MPTISNNGSLFSGDAVRIALQQFPQSMQQSAADKSTQSVIPLEKPNQKTALAFQWIRFVEDQPL